MSTKTMEIFAKRLKGLRETKGLTIREIAQELGISHTAYLKYEHNKYEPTQELMVKIAFFFGVTTDYLYGLSDV